MTVHRARPTQGLQLPGYDRNVHIYTISQNFNEHFNSISSGYSEILCFETLYEPQHEKKQQSA